MSAVQFSLGMLLLRLDSEIDLFATERKKIAEPVLALKIEG